MKAIRVLSLMAIPSIFAVAVFAEPTTPALPAGQALENSGLLLQDVNTPKPIVVQWVFKSLHGSANLIVNPDGTWLFSGQDKVKEPDKDFDVTLALKSDFGIILFRYSGNAKEGVVWSKEGQSDILKHNFQSFAKKIQWAGSYRLPLSSEGRAKLYQEHERKREKLEREKKDSELKKQAQEEAQQEAAAAAAAQQSGGGTSFGDVMSDITSVAGTATTVASDIAAMF